MPLVPALTEAVEKSRAASVLHHRAARKTKILRLANRTAILAFVSRDTFSSATAIPADRSAATRRHCAGAHSGWGLAAVISLTHAERAPSKHPPLPPAHLALRTAARRTNHVPANAPANSLLPRALPDSYPPAERRSTSRAPVPLAPNREAHPKLSC